MESAFSIRKNKIKKTFRINPRLLREVRSILGTKTATETIERALEQILFKTDIRKWIDQNAGRFPDL